MSLFLPHAIILGASFVAFGPPRPTQTAKQLIDTVAPQEIEGGHTPEPGEYSAVVALRPHLQICSGVMVSSTVLLTAAHCVDEIGFGQQITMYHGPTVDDSRRHQAKDWAAHPSYCPDCRDDRFDIGYVTLTLPYEPEGDGEGYAIPVATQGEWDELMHDGRALQVVGYGSGEDVEDAGVRTKRVTEVELVDLTRSGRELHAQSITGKTEGGDSGGPYFATGADGEQRLVAIHSRINDRSGVMIATPPFPALCWLRDETDVDLLPSPDADCASLDTARGGCRMAAADDRGLILVLLVLLLVLLPRRAHQPIAC